MIPDTHAALAAQEQIRELAELVRKDLPNRLHLGRKLIQVRDRRLYEHMLPPFRTWLEWLEEPAGFKKLTGLSDRTAHDCMYLAESKTLAALPDSEVEKIASVSNGKRIAKMDRLGITVTSEHVTQSQTMKTSAFRNATGQSGNGYHINTWVEDPEAGAHIQAIVEILKRCTSDALEQFRVRLAALDAIGITSPDLKLDVAMAGMNEALAEARA